MIPKIFLSIASASGLLAVMLGAFGAHALREQLGQQALSAWQTAVQYHFFHSLALVAVAILALQLPRTALLVSGSFFSAGLLLFSGSLYLLAIGGPRWLGPITPLGGMCFMVGWAALFIYAFSLNPKSLP